MSHFRQLPSPVRPKGSLQPPVLMPCMLLFRKHAILYQPHPVRYGTPDFSLTLCCPQHIRMVGSVVFSES